MAKRVVEWRDHGAAGEILAGAIQGRSPHHPTADRRFKRDGMVFEGQRVTCSLQSSLIRSLQEMSQKAGTTLYMLLLAAYKVLLHKYTGQEDIVVGTPVSGRNHPNIESMIGLFIQTIGIRTKPHANKRFADYLEEVKRQTLDAFENQDYPFDWLVEKLNVHQETTGKSLFNTMFVFQNIEFHEIQQNGCTFRVKERNPGVSLYDLMLTIEDAGNSWRCISILIQSCLNKKPLNR